MLQFKSSRSGFTLIELLVVVIIVAVLAAVGVPLLSANVDRARLSEADAGLGTIRTGMRARFAEFGNYTEAALPTSVTDDGNVGTKYADLCGRFFSADDFAFVGVPSATFCIGVNGSAADGTCPSGAPRGSKIPATTWRAMDEKGHIYAGITGSPSCGGTPIN